MSELQHSYSVTTSVLNSPGKPSDVTATLQCYHCGLSLLASATHSAPINGHPEPFCCVGCATVAQTIHAGGLASFYQQRGNLAQPVDLTPDEIAANQHYDTPEMRGIYLKPVGKSQVEASFTLENLQCAACVWLCEKHLEQQPGLTLAQVNFATGRARIRWEEGQSSLFAIIQTLAQIGYRAHPYAVGVQDQAQRKARKTLLIRSAVAWLCMMQVMMYAWPLYFYGDTIEPLYVGMLHWVSLALTMPVVLYSAIPLYRGAWMGLKNRHVNMDVPVVLGIAAAFLASVVATVRVQGEIYYDSVTMFVALLLSARYIEAVMRGQAQSGLQALAAQLPAVCRRAVNFPFSHDVKLVSRGLLTLNDVIQVRPGEAVPADGVVLEGHAEMDESILTGESRPLLREPGARVLAGSYNCASPFWMRVEAVGAQTRLAEIVSALDEALESKPRIARIADRVARHFIVALLALAAAAALYWLWADASRALPITIAVLVVSCPCALSMATPAALAASTASLARRGVVVVRGTALETLTQVTDVVLDKTGTLTEGSFSLSRIDVVAGQSEAVCLALAAGLEQGSSHPVGLALLQAAQQRGLAPTQVTGEAPRHVLGKGVEWRAAQGLWRLGSFTFAAPGQREEVLAAEDTPQTRIYLSCEGEIQACFLLADRLRPHSAEMVAALQSQGYRLHILSGDRRDTVAHWSSVLHIEQAVGEASPEDKQAYVEALQAGGAVVMAVGDGVNDALLLARAQVSLAVAGSTPLAQASADIQLMRGGVDGVLAALRTAMRCRQVIRQNLAWALSYNVSFIPLAACGFISAGWAALGMSLSSLMVVLNAWRASR